jgi:hypothetical protein
MAWLRGSAFIARTPGSTPDAIFVTARGHEALTRGITTVRAVRRVEHDLHPLIAQRVRRQFLLGEYEQAVFVAMKAIEVRVRQLGGFPDDKVGVPLMQRVEIDAFTFDEVGFARPPGAARVASVGRANQRHQRRRVLRGSEPQTKFGQVRPRAHARSSLAFRHSRTPVQTHHHQQSAASAASQSVGLA